MEADVSHMQTSTDNYHINHINHNSNGTNNDNSPSLKYRGVSITGIRRRVYFFGFVGMLMSLGQIGVYMFMLTFSISQEYSDYQVAIGSGWMVVITSIYLALTSRVLFLLYERRYEEAEGPQWLWWYASVAVVLFNMGLVIWFGMLSDLIPAIVCGVAVFVYLLFFRFASVDIKHIGIIDDKTKHRKSAAPVEENPSISYTHSETIRIES